MYLVILQIDSTRRVDTLFIFVHRIYLKVLHHRCDSFYSSVRTGMTLYLQPPQLNIVVYRMEGKKRRLIPGTVWVGGSSIVFLEIFIVTLTCDICTVDGVDVNDSVCLHFISAFPTYDF